MIILKQLSLKRYLAIFITIGFFHCVSAQVSGRYNNNQFWGNVRLGGSAGVSFGDDYFSLSLTPTSIYRITSKFSIGLGVNFTYTNNDSYNATVIGPTISGYYFTTPRLRLSAEYEPLHINKSYKSSFLEGIDDSYWYTALHLGIGYIAGPVTAGIRYNVLHDDDESIYASAFMPFVYVNF